MNNIDEKERKRQIRNAKKYERKRNYLNLPLWKRIAIKLFYGVFACGLLMLVYPYARDIYLAFQYANQPKITLAKVKKNEKKTFTREEDIKPVRDSDVWGLNWNMDRVIGGLYIPTTQTKAVVTNGYTNQSLYTSLGTFYPNQKMGEGNYVVLGHNYERKGVALSDLQNAKLGDSVYLTDLRYVYEYKITYNAKTSVEDIYDKFLGDDTKPVITIFTCEDGSRDNNGGYDYRHLARGTYVGKTPIKESQNADLVKQLKIEV